MSGSVMASRHWVFTSTISFLFLIPEGAAFVLEGIHSFLTDLLNADAVRRKKEPKQSERFYLLIEAAKPSTRATMKISKANKSSESDRNGFIYLTVLPTNIKQPQH